MYKRAVITDEISQDLRAAAALAAKYGLQGVELRSVEEKLPHELSDGEIKDVKSICGQYGLTVCGLSSPCFKSELEDNAEFEKQLEIFRRTAYAAQRLGVDKIRGFTFWKKGDFDAALPKIAERYQAAVKICEKEGMRIVIEHDPSVYAPNAATLARVIAAIGSPLVGALWDPGNDIYSPLAEKPYPDGYGIIKPYMSHFHLKDAKIGADGRAEGAMLGSGEVDVAGQLAALKADGYDGWAVLETHWRVSEGISEQLLKAPRGARFSAGGYEASELCLQQWNRLEGI